jgi:hypothetical protein
MPVITLNLYIMFYAHNRPRCVNDNFVHINLSITYWPCRPYPQDLDHCHNALSSLGQRVFHMLLQLL